MIDLELDYAALLYNAEKHILRSEVQPSFRGFPNVVTITGQAGTGRTTLALELMHLCYYLQRTDYVVIYTNEMTPQTVVDRVKKLCPEFQASIIVVPPLLEPGKITSNFPKLSEHVENAALIIFDELTLLSEPKETGIGLSGPFYAAFFRDYTQLTKGQKQLRGTIVTKHAVRGSHERLSIPIGITLASDLVLETDGQVITTRKSRSGPIFPTYHMIAPSVKARKHA